MLVEARCYESLGDFRKSIELYREGLDLQYSMYKTEDIEFLVGILSALTYEANTIIDSEEHRRTHFESALIVGKSLLTEFVKSKQKNRCFSLTVCLRFIIRCAYELKLKEEIIESIYKLNEIFKLTLRFPDSIFPGLIQQLFMILEECPGVDIRETLEIF